MNFLRRVVARRGLARADVEIISLMNYIDELNKLLVEAIAVLKIHDAERAEQIAGEFDSLTTKALYDSVWRQNGEEANARSRR